ncbi:tRNA (adenosine(37)-N6)-threonylcarbamoyltransferase complex transferase subunit TsaD [Patescibacteria group bacterium]|nr:tRNA (adenosine(37)-N6)-threonylcarbamoyltransferase complex transferase subunit TsaD [Patescibacteria group bacterium]
MIILGIESSCDDTSVALIDITDKRIEILAEKTASQIEVHKKYGGVVPEIAGRLHAEKILPVIESVFAEATPDKEVIKPDVIAVTSGPGLITGLLVGVEASKTLSYLWNVPIVSVNHIEGHIHSVQIQNHKSKIVNKFNYPVLSLVASGGHSEIILSTEEGKYEKIGGTCDDAAGECFDKVAKLLGFDYPGGPKISQFAETGNPEAIKFPRPMIDSDNFDFSFLLYIIGLAFLGWECAEIGYSCTRYKTLIPDSENFLGLNLYIDGADVILLHEFRCIIGGALTFIGGML